jgi:hypothetical protein
MIFSYPELNLIEIFANPQNAQNIDDSVRLKCQLNYQMECNNEKLLPQMQKCISVRQIFENT